MSMHLVHPSLTTTGKMKGKKKFKSAEHARRAREAELERQKMLKELDTKPKFKHTARSEYTFSDNVRRETAPVKSAPFTGGACTKTEPKRYSGDLLIGIAQMHKSNAVPVISATEAEEIAKMRRN